MLQRIQPSSLAHTEPPMNPGRRSLLRAMFGSFVGLGFAALGVTGGLWAAATARFLSPNVVNQPPAKFKVGLPSDYPPGHVETKFKEPFGVWIVHGTYQGKAQIFALSTVCTHLGCMTNWQQGEQKFRCPCHGSGFSRDGINMEGPAPRALERYAIAIADNGQMEVDKSRTFQEELGQWLDPNGYVPG